MSRQNFAAPQILFEDAQILVCVKPAGVPTQTARVSSKDMVSILKTHLTKSQKNLNFHSSSYQKTSAPYLALIHRLDQPVEGILIFAKTPFAAKELNRQLVSDKFKKYYHADVTGILEKGGTLTNFLKKDSRSNLSVVCEKDTIDGKSATLEYEILRASQKEDPAPHTLVKIHLKTGRHHQIRVQFAHLGHPILGDRKYGNADVPPEAPFCLCACRLSFMHPKTKEVMDFSITPSWEFR